MASLNPESEPSLATPELGHLTKEDYQRVYEPAEDTFLLLDAIEKVFPKHTWITSVLEIGCGSGCVSTFIAKHFPLTYVMATDINVFACDATQRTARANHVVMDVALSDTGQGIRDIDCVVCNPPYVPDTIQGRDPLNWAWAGGSGDARLVIDRVVENASRVMTEHGALILLIERRNNPAAFRKWVFENFGLHSTIIIERKAGRERLVALLFRRAGWDLGL